MAGERAYWDNNLTKTFLDLCIAEKEKLNFSSRSLTRAGWKNVHRNFCLQTGRAYDTKQLQSKLNSLKRLYRCWRKLKNTTGAGWDQATGTITGDSDWWEARIAENPDVAEFRTKPLPHQHELTTLFGNMHTEEGDMLCVGGIGDSTPSRGSEENPVPQSDDNVGGSAVGQTSQRAQREQVVDSPPPKRCKSSTEIYLERISECMLQRSKNETTPVKQQQEEVREMLNMLKEDGLDPESELYFIATDLFRSPSRRAAFSTLPNSKARQSWLQWTWDKSKKK
ncbi:hypothetical protein ACP4OV_018124 [Aristida adscensionis]